MAADGSRFKCFSCGLEHPRNRIRKSGVRKDGVRWFLCKECSSSYRSAKQLEAERFSSSDRVLTDSGKVELGWNGVPSEKSLKRRSR